MTRHYRTLGVGLSVKSSLRKRAFKLKIWKSRSDYLITSSSAFRTPKWQNNILEISDNNNDFLFGLWNCHSAGSKFCSLRDYITSQQIGMFGLTETWLSTDIDKAILKKLLPPGYKIHHQPRLGKKRPEEMWLFCTKKISMSYAATVMYIIILLNIWNVNVGSTVL